LEEIEKVLIQHDSIKDVAVMASEAEDDDKQLVAYYIPSAGKEAKPGDLRRFLEKKLPYYMCPAVFVKMRTFPSTPNGKIDRKAFPKPEANVGSGDSDYVAPRTNIEKQLTNIWEGLLKHSPIGVNDNFFYLGGHSILVVQLQVRVWQQMGIRVVIRDFLEAPTIASLARHIEAMSWATASALGASSAVEEETGTL